ncbi:group II intron reverse transcriptase/maturase [Cytobacillus praedii]|uniref:group II intron reverse transcriptase/maturase n=1 Tax=Cytobacillus praedii TaxID=1742358 RepID=UPI003F816768
MLHLSQRTTKGKSTVPLLTNWKDVNWHKISKYVMRLQQRIYRAECKGNKRQVRELQRLLMRSQAALLLSIRRATQLNKGKRTAGVDGYTALTPKKRVTLYNNMRKYNLASHNPPPVKRHYIPKKNKRLRPLGIPTIKDRVYQNIVKLALEPQWETRFESTSYGFRPKRSTHDAISDIFNKTCKGDKWIFEGDFEGCFDNLSHDFIMEQINCFPANKIVKKWLTAGYVDNNVFKETNKGTPQGGIVSPLLANIALHGMEEELGIIYIQRRVKGKDCMITHPKMTHSMVRYADDFVIICKSRGIAESMYGKLQPYLDKRGLKLAEDKTRITHIYEGFDFLGVNIRRYKQAEGKTKLLIKPAKEKINEFRRNIKVTCKKARGHNLRNLIGLLNPIIRGWGNYYRPYVSSDIFAFLDYQIAYMTHKWLKKQHRMMPMKKLKQRFYKPDRTGVSKVKWILTCPETYMQKTRLSWIGIERHVKIAFKNSPFDRDLKDYFLQRSIKEFNSNNTLSRQKIAKKQKYLCTLCGHTLTGEEGLEIHHKVPVAQNGDNSYQNLELVHISCHIDHHKINPVKGIVPPTRRLRTEREQRWINRYFRDYYELNLMELNTLW